MRTVRESERKGTRIQILKKREKKKNFTKKGAVLTRLLLAVFYRGFGQKNKLTERTI